MRHGLQPRVALATDSALAAGRPDIERYRSMAHIKLDVLAENGYAILGDGPAIPPEEWERLEYVDWKSGGDTNFAPLASAKGEMECARVLGPRQARQGRHLDVQSRDRADTVQIRRGGRSAIRARARDQAQPVVGIGRRFASSIRTTTTASIRTARAGWSARGSSSTPPRDRSSSCARFAMTRRPRAAFPSTRAGSSSSIPNGCITWCTTRGRVRGTRLITSFESGDTLNRWIDSQRKEAAQPV